MLQRVADRGSNAPENIELAVRVIGRSRVKRAVFKAVHSGRKQSKTVDEIARETGEGRQQVLNAAGVLAQQGIIHPERRGRQLTYRRDPFYQGNREQILRFVDRPGSIERLPTKRRPEVPRERVALLEIPVRQSQIRTRAITIDDIQSFSRASKVKAAPRIRLTEAQTKDGLLRIIGETGHFKDWGGERNDFLTDRLVIGGRRRVAAFALKGPGKTGILTPAKMGLNGDQIQRLAQSPAQVLVVQYHDQIGDAVRDQLQQFAQLKSVWENRLIWYCVIDGDDTDRLVSAYRADFLSQDRVAEGLS